MGNPGISWGMVTDGATFESLMQALAYANEPGVRMFGRLGKDQGMDARSSDGTRVYQAKYIGNHSFEEAIERAKKELTKFQVCGIGGLGKCR